MRTKTSLLNKQPQKMPHKLRLHQTLRISMAVEHNKHKKTMRLRMFPQLLTKSTIHHQRIVKQMPAMRLR